ncbi:hypothetical protein QCA50_008490 [Cerrena zonata]|uniref:Intersectin-EH binding protein Ibp1 n=1 Tax=Cerrena zonata TaxID=2478898 RepID=A0AAW0GGI0_9APHY
MTKVHSNLSSFSRYKYSSLMGSKRYQQRTPDPVNKPTHFSYTTMFTTRVAAFALAAAMFFAGQAQAANTIPRAALIATDPVAACNPPNNGDHTLGSSCKFFSGPSDSSPVISGTCVPGDGGTLTCVRS